MVLNEKDRGLGLKSNEQHMRKDDYVNEHLGLAIRTNKLNKLLNDYRNEEILCIM